MNFKFLFILITCLFVLPACSLFKPVPDDINLSITTSTQLNPDKEGRSSPVVLRIYELSSDQHFKEKDFFDIYDDDKTALADSFIGKQELELNPNESRKLQLAPKSSTRFIGLLAAFRNLEQSTWREVIPVDSSKPTGILLQKENELAIRLDKNSITLIKN